MTMQEARSKCPLGQEYCYDCPRYQDDCDGMNGKIDEKDEAMYQGMEE